MAFCFLHPTTKTLSKPPLPQFLPRFTELSSAPDSSMAPKTQKKVSDSKKRKTTLSTKSVTKKPKFDSNNIQTKVAKMPSVLTKHNHQKKEGRTGVKYDGVTDSKKQRCLDAKELAVLWEKIRRRNIAKDDRSMLVSEALKKMKGKISEIASSHVSSCVLQTCVKYST